MFKKNISVLQQRQTSGKDGKQLRRDIQIQFPDLSEDEVKELLPAKAEVVVLKLSNRSQAYSVDGEVLFFDPEGRGDLLVPTVYTMWRLPHILPAVQTYSEVSPKVLGGADLFLQGFIVPPDGLPHFAIGDLMAITVRGNDLPFAIGTMETSIEAVNKTGLKGKGVKLLHHYPDQLWQLGDKSTPHASFTTGRIFPKEDSNGPEAKTAEPSSAEAQTSKAVSNLSLDDRTAGEDFARPAAQAESAQELSEPSESGRPGDETEMAAVDGASMSQDELAEYCLLAGLLSLSDEELPIMTSDFYSKHMLPTKPPGATMDIKKSSYKKLSKLLQKFEKKGLLTQKVVHKQDHISAVNRSSKLLEGAASQPAPSKGEKAAQEAASTTSNDPQTSGKIEVSYCYRFPSSLRPILGASASPNKDELYSEAEVRAALQSYAATNSLAGGDESAIRLDRLLLGNLFNKKEVAEEGSDHPTEDLVTRLFSKLQLYHRVVRLSEQGMPIEQVNKGQVKNVVIQTEDRQGGRKHVTKITHVESFGLVPEDLGGILQRKFQTSSSVQKLPGKNETGKEISLQGDLLQEIPGFLSTACGIDAQYITTISKKKPPK